MNFTSESQLQDLIIKILQDETILDVITGQEEIDDHLNRDSNDKFIPGFQIDFQLRTLYCRKAKEVLDSFNSYDIITGEKIKNISIQKDTKTQKERIYPDILISNPEKKNFSILELKKNDRTERETITELFAYAIELKNHLPNIADTDINLVIVSTDFNTLLDHSVSSIILGTRFNVLALKAGLNDDGQLILKLHFPDSWTDIWQNSLPEYAFSSVTLVPYRYRKEEIIPDEVFLFDIIDDLTTFNGAKNNSHGFFIIWKNITSLESDADFCISFYQINPFVFLQSSINSNFTLNTNQPLSRYIVENYEENIYHHSDSLMNICSEVKVFLDRYFDTHYEGFSSWTDHMQLGSYFRSQARPIVFNSWGHIGDYIRYYFFHPSLKNGFFSQKQLDSPFFYKDPLFGIELINRISGNTLFENGVYNFSSLYGYTRQLRELIDISEWYLKTKKENKKYELLTPRLFYAVLDVLSSVREIQYRVNYIDVKLASPKPLKINPYEVHEDAVDNIMEQCKWFAEEFLNNNPFHQEFFISALNWSVLFMHEDMPKEEAFERDVRKQLIEYVRAHLFAIIHDEVISKRSFFGDRLFSLLEPYFDSLDDIIEQTEEQKLIEIIESIDESSILAHFESVFLPVLDLVYSEVFHPLVEFSDLTFITKDWKKIQAQLIKRFNEGHKYGAIMIDSNGNLSLGILPKEFQLLKPIENPEKEVYVLMNESGIGIASLVTWEEVKNGTAFKTKNRNSL